MPIQTTRLSVSLRKVFGACFAAIALTFAIQVTASRAEDAATCMRKAEESLRYKTCVGMGRTDCSGFLNEAYRSCMTGGDKKAEGPDPKCEARVKEAVRRCEMMGSVYCEPAAAAERKKCEEETRPGVALRDSLRDKLRRRLGGDDKRESFDAFLNMCCESQCITLADKNEAGIQCGRMNRSDVRIAGGKWLNIRDVSFSPLESCPKPVLEEFFKKGTRGAGPTFVCRPPVAAVEPTPAPPEELVVATDNCPEEKIMGVCPLRLAGPETEAEIRRLLGSVKEPEAPKPIPRREAGGVIELCFGEPGADGYRREVECPPPPKFAVTLCYDKPAADGIHYPVPCPKNRDSDITGIPEDRAKRVALPDPEPLPPELKLDRPDFRLPGWPAGRGPAVAPRPAPMPVAKTPPAGRTPPDVPGGKSDTPKSDITGRSPPETPKSPPAKSPEPKPEPKVVSRPDPTPAAPPPAAAPRNGPGGIKLDVKSERERKPLEMDKKDVLKLLPKPGS
jgi:hypothetical protein